MSTVEDLLHSASSDDNNTVSNHEHHPIDEAEIDDDQTFIYAVLQLYPLRLFNNKAVELASDASLINQDSKKKIRRWRQWIFTITWCINQHECFRTPTWVALH